MTSYLGENQMLKTWKPTVAGIFNLISGVFFLLGGIIIISTLSQLEIAMPWASYAMYSMGIEGEPSGSFVTTFIVILGTAAILAGVISILGGIYSIRRRLWGIALAGSIFTFLSLIILGIPTLLLTAISKREFV